MVIVSRLNDYLGQTLDCIFNLPGKFDELSDALQARLAADFGDFGLRLSHLYITSITPPEEVQSAIDDKSRMELIHDMDKFLQLKTATAMEKAAGSQGEAGAGLGMGMGMMLPGIFAAQNTRFTGGGALPPQVALIQCPDCSADIAANARFCPLCGHQQVLLRKCSNCGKNLTPNAGFCSRCGQAAEQQKPEKVCPGCGLANLPDSMYCNSCGEKLTATR